MPVLLRKCSFVFYSHMELVDTSPTDFQRVFEGPMPQVGAIKIVVLGVQSKPFTAQGSWELEIPFWLYGTVLGMGFVARVCLSLSYLFWCGYFLIHLMCRSCSVSLWISFWETCCMGSCTSGASVEEVISGTTYVTLLVNSRSLPSWNITLRWRHLCNFLKFQKYFRREMPNKYFK